MTPDGSARLAAKPYPFADLPPIGAARRDHRDPRRSACSASSALTFANGVKALMWPNNAEAGPGDGQGALRRSGCRSFDADDAVYAALGQMALVGSGVGTLGQEELDRISTGRKMGFDFKIEDGAFAFAAQTRAADLADQLYLFAAKLGMPRWDANPVIRAKAAARLAYDTYATSPSGVLERDLDFETYGRDAAFATPGPAELDAATPEGFRQVWAPPVATGPVEVQIFGDFDKAAAVEALRKTFGALPPRAPIPAAALARVPRVPTRRGAAAGAQPPRRCRPVRRSGDLADRWRPASLRESRQLELLAQLFNNRLLDPMRERTGASYAPQVGSSWPEDLRVAARSARSPASGRRMCPRSSRRPMRSPQDLRRPPAERRRARAGDRAAQAAPQPRFDRRTPSGSTSSKARPPTRAGSTSCRSLLADYTETTPAEMQALARKFLSGPTPLKMAIIPQGAAARHAGRPGAAASR